MRIAAVLAGILLAAGCASRPGLSPTHRWYTVPIEVSGRLPDATFTPVTLEIDFDGLGTGGTVDTRTIRLFRGGVEVPVQFTPDVIPRPARRTLLEDTPPGMSLLGDYRAGEGAVGLPVRGTLTWNATADRYTLLFGVPLGGRWVHVPFLPRDLHAFDAEGRATPGPPATMRIRPQWPLDGRISITRENALVAGYRIGPEREDVPVPRRPFFYPVLGPDGDPLTGYGKTHDPTGSHRHHTSLWIAHANVDGHNFWSDRGGVIVHDGFDLMEEGPVFCRFVQRTRWMDKGAVVLRERRTVTVYDTPEPFRAIDLSLELSPPGDDPVVLGKTTFGFLAVRVAPNLSVFDGGGEIRNGAGGLNERGAHLKRAPWIDLSGPLGPGRTGGVALLDAPVNPRHPTLWHCRDDGWAGASVTGTGPLEIRPGTPLVLHYRVLLHRGDAEGGRVARHHAGYGARLSARLAPSGGRATPIMGSRFP